MREDTSFVSSTGPDQFSETAVFSGSDSETPSQDLKDQLLILSHSEPPPPTSPDLPSPDQNHVYQTASDACDETSNELHLDTDTEEVTTEEVTTEEVTTEEVKENGASPQKEEEAESSVKSSSEASVQPGPRRSASLLSRKLSTDSLSVSI